MVSTSIGGSGGHRRSRNEYVAVFLQGNSICGISSHFVELRYNFIVGFNSISTIYSDLCAIQYFRFRYFRYRIPVFRLPASGHRFAGKRYFATPICGANFRARGIGMPSPSLHFGIHPRRKETVERLLQWPAPGIATGTLRSRNVNVVNASLRIVSRLREPFSHPAADLSIL